MNPIDSIVDFSAASTTLAEVARTASPVFGATIKPAMQIEGIHIAGIVVSVVVAAVVAAVTTAVYGLDMQSWFRKPTGSGFKGNPGYVVDLSKSKVIPFGNDV